MVDDVIDDVQSFVDAATVLKERGAYKIYVLATHGILSKEAPRLIEDSVIDEVFMFFLNQYIFVKMILTASQDSPLTLFGTLIWNAR